jgi:hypothetical protein
VKLVKHQTDASRQCEVAFGQTRSRVASDVSFQQQALETAIDGVKDQALALATSFHTSGDIKRGAIAGA